MEKVNLYDTYNNGVFQGKHIANLTFDNISIQHENINFMNVKFEQIKGQDLKFGALLQVNVKIRCRPLKKEIGEIIVFDFKRNHLNNNSVNLPWILDAVDIAELEKSRHQDLNFNIYFSCVVELLGKKKPEPISIQGEQQVIIPKSTWINFMEQLGYKTIHLLEVPRVLAEDNSWIEATKRLSEARELLRIGRTHDALSACYSVIEGFSPNHHGGAYKDDWWKEFLKDIHPSQKKIALTKMFSGISTYLSKVARHRDGDADPVQETKVPVDQYEAEILMSMTHLMVTYMERLK